MDSKRKRQEAQNTLGRSYETIHDIVSGSQPDKQPTAPSRPAAPETREKMGRESKAYLDQSRARMNSGRGPGPMHQGQNKRKMDTLRTESEAHNPPAVKRTPKMSNNY